MPAFWILFNWIITVALIYFHQRWAVFDPFNPEADDGHIWTLILSVVVASGYFIALALFAAGSERMAAFVIWICMGSMIGAVTIGGVRYRSDEISDSTPRWVEEKKEVVKSIAFGIIVVGVLNAVLGLLPWHPPKHTVVFCLTVALGLGRLAKAYELNATESLGPIYEKPGIARNVARRAVRGLLAVVVLYSLAFPVLSSIEPLSALELVTIVGLLLGGLLAVALA